MHDFTYSPNGIAFTEGFEGFTLTPYRDVAGVLTVGYGHTGRGIVERQRITRSDAVNLLRADTAAAVACVNRAVTVDITQGEFDSLVDFTFNVGCRAFLGSTWLKKLNAADFKGASEQFLLWVNAGGKRVEGLLRRRLAEQALFVRSEVGV